MFTLHSSCSRGTANPRTHTRASSLHTHTRAAVAPFPGFYPQLLRVDAPAAKFQKVHGGAVEVDAEPHKLKFFDRERGACVRACLCTSTRLLLVLRGVPAAAACSASYDCLLLLL